MTEQALLVLMAPVLVTLVLGIVVPVWVILGVLAVVL